MANGNQDLYSLLPAIYRERDAQQNFQLQSLLSLLDGQRALADSHIQQFQENLFIETCQNWVIPYIGDLVSNNLLFDPSRSSEAETATSLFPDLIGKDLRPPVAIRIRADVAKTIHYRRRKATPAMLEELARDVTGWPAHVVEFFQLLGWTQFLEHLRFQCTWTDVRSIDAMERIAGAFDQTMHTVDVRQPLQPEGWYNIRNIGLFLWRLQSFPLVNVPARPTTVAWRYHFSPLGNPAPLFTRLRREVGGLVTEYDVPAPIRRVLFDKDLRDYAARDPRPPPPSFTRLYGAFGVSPTDPAVASETSLYVSLNGNGIDPADPNAPPNTFIPQIVCMRLDPWPATQPAGKIVAIDVHTGRLAIGAGWGPINSVDVSYWYGFSSSLGGGTYDRRKWLENPHAFPTPPTRYAVQQNGPAGTFPSVAAALTQWQSDTPKHAIISILDNRTYGLPGSITLANGTTLAIEAAQGTRPLLQAQTPGGALAIDVSGIAPNDDQRNAAFTLNGVVLEGSIHVIGDLGKLRLLHSTLIPGRQLDGNGDPISPEPSVSVEPANATSQAINLLLRIEAAFSILGQLVVPEPSAGIWLLDCIVQGTGASPAAVSDPAGKFAAPLVTERSTFFGSVQVKSLQASEVIFSAALTAQRTQQGCVRFSYVPPGSVTPRRYRCQPDVALSNAIAAALQTDPLLSLAAQQQIRQDVESRVVPSFTTTLYGQPAYAQLLLSCPVEIRTGAEDGSEMGAFCHLKQPQRESNLKIRLQEYLPFGLDPAVIYVT
jgi:hypothetical protein